MEGSLVTLSKPEVLVCIVHDEYHQASFLQLGKKPPVATSGDDIHRAFVQ